MANTLTLSPADVLAYLLVERGLGTNPTADSDWPVLANVKPDSPDNLIVVGDTAGTTSNRTMPDGATNEKYGFQILVRGKTQPLAWAKIDEIQRDLSRNLYHTSFAVDGATYTVKKVVNFGPVIRMGLERPASKRFLYTLNALALIEMEADDAPAGALTDHLGNYLLDHNGEYLLGA